MRNTITLNGQSSEGISGLLIQSLPPISKPAMRTEIEEIDGRDGDIVTKLGFSAYDKEISIGLYGNYDINQIISFFNSEGTVVFSNEPDKYYNYKIINQIDFEKLIRFKTATVTMHVQPFKYSTTEGALILRGANLMSFDDFTTTINGVTVTALNGSVVVSGTASAATEIYMPIDEIALEAGDYAFEAFASGIGPEACSLRVINNSPSSANSFGGTYATLANNQIVSINATLSEDKTYNYLYFYITAGTAMNFTLGLDLANAEARTVSAEGNDIYLEDTAEAPLVSFELKGDVAQKTYSGKNLYLPIGTTDRGITTTYDTDTGELTLSGTATDSWSNCTTNSNVDLPAGTYTFSASSLVGTSAILRASLSGGGSVDFNLGTQNTSVTKTVSSSITGIRFWLGTNSGQTYNWSGILQFEAGATSTEIEPYVGGVKSPNPNYPQNINSVTGEQTITISDENGQSQVYEVNLGDIELCKIGTYQDYIYKSSGNWYLHKEINKINLADYSQVDWYTSGAGSVVKATWAMMGISNVVPAVDNNTAGNLICNFFTNGAINPLWSGSTSTGCGLGVDGFYFANENWSAAEFKTFISNNTVYCYYCLATPTDTQITDETLISQLETIENQAHSYAGFTRITSGASDENNLPNIIEAEAFLERNGVINNSGNIPAKPILTIYGSGNIGISLNGIQMFNIALGDEDHITIDTNAMEAYQDTPEDLKNRLVDGNYNNFMLNPGESLLEFSGVVEKCIVEDYSRWL